jgi:hypothetical protein
LTVWRIDAKLFATTAAECRPITDNAPSRPRNPIRLARQPGSKGLHLNSIPSRGWMVAHSYKGPRAARSSLIVSYPAVSAVAQSARQAGPPTDVCVPAGFEIGESGRSIRSSPLPSSLASHGVRTAIDAFPAHVDGAKGVFGRRFSGRVRSRRTTASVVDVMRLGLRLPAQPATTCADISPDALNGRRIYPE